MAEETVKKPRGRPRLPPEQLKKNQKPRGKYVKGVPRDFAWHYQDPNEHAMHLPFLRARAQANFRNEGWTLTIEQWFALWRDRWHLRRRTKDSLCLTRRDWSKPWQWDNVEIVTRQEQLARAAHEAVEYRLATGRYKVSTKTVKNYTGPRTRGQRGPDRHPRKRKGVEQ